MKFNEKASITGYLQIAKAYPDGTEEIVFDDHNVITSGMSVGLSHLFTASGSERILDYQIDRFQVGVSGGTENQLSSTYQLSGPLSNLTEYGSQSDLFLTEDDQLINGDVKLGGDFSARGVAPFALIPFSKITRIDDRAVRYTLILDEKAAVKPDGTVLTRAGGDESTYEVNLNEVGLFMKNPLGRTDPTSILVAYRSFSDIAKTDDFALVFRWTLNF